MSGALGGRGDVGDVHAQRIGQVTLMFLFLHQDLADVLGDLVELYARYEQMEAIGATDPTLLATVQTAGRATASGVNVYVNGHSFKLQLDWQHTFGSDYTIGEHLFRLQLDATF